MRKYTAIPIGRILDCLPKTGTWHGPAYQGIGGLFAIRGWGAGDRPPMFQVMRVYGRRHGDPAHDRPPEEISGPWLTMEGAEQFARRMAEGGSPRERFA